MTESILITGETKTERYESLLSQVKALTEGEKDEYAFLGNIMSAIKYGMKFFWVGLYKVKGDELVLGPFQGTVACSRIAYGKGVCGRVWELNRALIVDDVTLFPGHIACSVDTRSEIVLPVHGKDGKVCMVLDIDSEHLRHFDAEDESGLTELVKLIETFICSGN
jgi:GAF domain-containing protein